MVLTLADLVLLAVLILGGTVLVFLIRLLWNLNNSASMLNEILKTNKENINETLQSLPAASKNLADITDTVKDHLTTMGAAIHNINETMEATAATVNNIKTNLFSSIKGLIEFFEFIKWIFFKNNNNNDGAKAQERNK